MTRFDRRALFASGAAAALLAATGVSAAPQRGGRLRAALTPALFERVVAATVCDNLTEIAADGTVRGELATDWETPDGSRIWDFTLRENVAFHDGSPFTWRDLEALGFNVKPLSAHKVRFSLDAPDPNFPYHLAFPGFEIRSSSGAGTGLYKPRKYDTARHFVGEKLTDHWKNSAGWFESVDFVTIPSEAVRKDALCQGLVDVVDVIDATALPPDRYFSIHPDSGPTMFVSRGSVAGPRTVGRVWPFDNLRLAERWWRT